MILYAHNLLPASSAGPSFSTEAMETVQFRNVVENHPRLKQMFAHQPLLSAPLVEHFAHYASTQEFDPSLAREFCFSIEQANRSIAAIPAGAPLSTLAIYSAATQGLITFQLCAPRRLVSAYEFFINYLLAQPDRAPYLLNTFFIELLEASKETDKLKADLDQVLTILGEMSSNAAVKKAYDVLNQCLYLAPRSSTSVPLSGRSSSSSSRTSAAPSTYPHTASALPTVDESFEAELDADDTGGEQATLSRHQLPLNLGFEGDVSPALFTGRAAGGAGASAGFQSPLLMDGRAASRIGSAPATKRLRYDAVEDQ